MIRNIQRVVDRHTYSSAADSMEVDGEGDGGVNLSALQQLFCREFTSLYLKMANTARMQCNYPVAKRYLQLTEAAVGEVREEGGVYVYLKLIPYSRK